MSARTRYAVQCVRHGVESKDWAGKQVVVPRPKNKEERRSGGCPFCNTERRLKETGHDQAA